MMTYLLAFLFPILVGIALGLFARALWQSSALEDRAVGDTQVHNERIYKDFELFIKVFLALGAGVGYVRLNVKPPATDRFELTLVLAAVGMISMGALASSVICHQASKIRRWEKPRLYEWWKWQEVWMAVAMYLLACGLWVWVSLS